VAFLAPDPQALAAVLAVAPLDEDTVRGIVEESNPTGQVQATIRKAASSTMRIFTHNGVLEDSRTFDAFARHGLVDA
jgi:hypothetical protein